jgi:hypothetical protein
MKVGDVVFHKDEPSLGKGKIVSFRVFHGTVLVRWKNLKECRYHIPWALKKAKK